MSSIQVKLAETSREIDQLFQLRHQVFCEERGYSAETPDRRAFDRFDALPGVANFIAIADGRVVGGWRIVEESGAGLPAYDYFDFESRLPQSADVRVGSVGMLVTHPAYRRSRLFFSLISAGHLWAARRGLTHLLAPAAPEVEPLARRLGYVALTPQFCHERLRLKVTPMLLDMQRMSAPLATSVAKHLRDDCAPRAFA
jgi:N-acyl-L-homoserine lactone synthetase